MNIWDRMSPAQHRKETRVNDSNQLHLRDSIVVEHRVARMAGSEIKDYIVVLLSTAFLLFAWCCSGVSENPPFLRQYECDGLLNLAPSHIFNVPNWPLVVGGFKHFLKFSTQQQWQTNQHRRKELYIMVMSSLTNCTFEINKTRRKSSRLSKTLGLKTNSLLTIPRVMTKNKIK